MNIATEKKENQADYKAKDSLDFSQTMNDTNLESELDIAIKQSDNREVRPHHIVWDEIRSNLYDEAALNSFRKTSKNYSSGKEEGSPAEESMKRIRKQIGKK